MIKVLYFFIAVLVIALMIFIHELGHYTAGRLLGFRILDFSIGFGPAIFKFKKKDITYALRAIPLGGACRFYGEDDDKIDDAVAFNSQKPWKRLIVIFAGPFMNFVLAYVLAFIMMLSFGSREIKTYPNGDYAITINEVTKGSPAEKAGIREGDEILSIGGTDVVNAPESYEDKTEAISKAIKEAPKEGVNMTVIRGSDEVTVFVSDIFSEKENRNFLGITMGYSEYFVPYGFFESFGKAGGFLVDIVVQTFRAIAGGFKYGFKTGDVSGIFGTVAITMKMASMGVYYVLFVMALISMSLGIMNLLPILPLDGGHLLFDFIELVVGKPVPRKIQTVLSLIGVALLILLFIFATIGDIKGLFSGLFNF